MFAERDGDLSSPLPSEDAAAALLVELKHDAMEEEEKREVAEQDEKKMGERIIITKGKRSFALRFGSGSEANTLQEQVDSGPARKAQRMWKHGDRVRKATECQWILHSVCCFCSRKFCFPVILHRASPGLRRLRAASVAGQSRGLIAAIIADV